MVQKPNKDIWDVGQPYNQERRSISDAEIKKRLVKERKMWERRKQREMREKGSSRRSRSRSRSPFGWLQRVARGGREAGARGRRGAGRGGGRAQEVADSSMRTTSAEEQRKCRGCRLWCQSTS